MNPNEQIVVIDRLLAMARDIWLGTPLEADKAKWRDRIDALLDERLAAMKLRDDAAQSLGA